MPQPRLWTALIISTLSLLSCTSTPPPPINDPVTVLLDTTQTHAKRWRAAKQAESDEFATPNRIAALKRMVYKQGYPAEFSNYAVDQLVKIDETAAQDFLIQQLIVINDWYTLQHIFDIAVQRNWTPFIPALVRNYAQISPRYPDLDRPERRAIAALASHQTPEATTLQVFLNTIPANIHQRTAAWQLICRLAPTHQDVIDLFTSLPINDPTDTLLVDLFKAASDLNVIPTNKQTITWIRILQTDLYRNTYNRMKHAVAQLSTQQKTGLKLRHLPSLLYLTQTATPPPHTFSHQQLLNQALAFNATQTHQLHGPNYDGPMQNHPQKLSQHTSTLTWPDLLTITFLQKLIFQPAFTKQLFAQADADLANKTTEYGGLIRLNKTNQPTPTPYPPAIIKHDLAYHPPPQLTLDAYTAIAHYHFHAQKHNNKVYAGPGQGDMQRTAQTHRLAGLVFTFINQNQINVDFYQDPQTVIDIGTINR